VHVITHDNDLFAVERCFNCLGIFLCMVYFIYLFSCFECIWINWLSTNWLHGTRSFFRSW